MAIFFVCVLISALKIVNSRVVRCCLSRILAWIVADHSNSCFEVVFPHTPACKHFLVDQGMIHTCGPRPNPIPIHVLVTLFINPKPDSNMLPKRGKTGQKTSEKKKIWAADHDCRGGEVRTTPTISSSQVVFRLGKKKQQKTGLFRDLRLQVQSSSVLVFPLLIDNYVEIRNFEFLRSLSSKK